MPVDQQHEHERLKQQRGEMSFFEHIGELRKHIVRSALAIMVLAVICFINKDFIFNTVIFGPRNPNFPTYRIMCEASHMFGLGEAGCFSPPKFTLITRQLGEVIVQVMYVSFWIGVIGAFPIIFWEFWKFISPGLHEHERRAARGVVFVCSLLFLLGNLFGYFIIAPFSISFLAGFTLEGLEVAPTLDSYVTYLTMFTIPTGFIFEMPVVAYFLARTGLIGASVLREYRRHSIVAILILAAVITPPDVVSQTLVAIPLFVLYEISINVVATVQKRRAKKELEEQTRELAKREEVESEEDKL